MTSFLDKLNLRPNELRLVVVVSFVIIAVLYALFIWPEFKEWNRLQEQKRENAKTWQMFQREITNTAKYQQELTVLKQKGRSVDSEAQALEMQRTVTSQAILTGVTINGYNPGRGPAVTGGKTNAAYAFFEETTGTINFLAEENALVNFLYALSSGDSLIRVSSMTLNPDPTQMKLMGNMTLVASYPKKTPARGTSPTPPPKSGGPGVPAPAKSPAPAMGSKSLSAAVAASTRPAATNPPPAASWWGKVKGLFGSSKTPAQPAVKPAVKPTAKPSPTNAPPAKKPRSP
jgi:hypothetical protein